MRLMIIFLSILLASSAFGEAQEIVCGTHPGEIYFVGVHPNLFWWAGFYHSSDYGEHIALRDSVTNPYITSYGLLLADVSDSTLYKFVIQDGAYKSSNGGYAWSFVSDTITRTYASGVIPGEIYRRRENNWNRMERSENYGFDYSPCSCTGFPNSYSIPSAALGSDSGEIYIWSEYTDLYFSCDHGENFASVGNMHDLWGISYDSRLFNGVEPGEIYIFHSEFERVWKVTEYGNNVQEIVNFNLGLGWYCSFAAGRIPGELYLLYVQPSIIQGGTMRIYHTTNHGQDWNMFEHYVGPNGVGQQNGVNMPDAIEVQIYPNPANASFNISYDLNAIQDVRLTMYDILGRQVWRNNIGTRSPGNYRLSFAGDYLPNGKYFVCLQSNVSNFVKPIIIIK